MLFILFVKGLKSIKLDFKNPADNLVDVVVSFFFFISFICRNGFTSNSEYLISQLLWKCISLIQGKSRHQFGGENVLAAEFVDYLWHVEEGLIFQKFPAKNHKDSESLSTSQHPRKSMPPRTCTTDRTWWWTHTHTFDCFCEKWGHPIGIMVFILYKLYVLLPYT